MKIQRMILGRRILSFAVAVALVVGLMPRNVLTVSAEGTDAVIGDEQGVSARQGEDTAIVYEVVASGTCGASTNEGGESSVKWTLDSEGTLTISGSGAMEDYYRMDRVPWYDNYSTAVKKVVINDGITHIGFYAFVKCSNLTSVSIPNSVISISSNAFTSCSGLTTISIPDGVSEIGQSAFYACGSLTTVNIPTSVTSIQSATFANCSSLQTISIPDNVKTIDIQAFFNCSGLQSITIPEGVTSIAKKAFKGCSALTSITIPNTVTDLGADAFAGCTNLATIHLSCRFDNNIKTTIGVENSVMLDISHYKEPGFEHCMCERNAYAGASVKWDLNAEGVLTFTGTGDMYKYANEGDVPWLQDGRKTSIKKVVINDGITSISSFAFKGCTNLTEITISKDVTTIGRSAFNNCKGLSVITLPNSLTTIDDLAFYNCDALSTIKIPDSVTTISSNTFQDCSSELKIYYSCRLGDYTLESGTQEKYHLNSCTSSGKEIYYTNCPCQGGGEYTATLSLSSDEPIYYTGEEIKPAVTVTYPEGWGGEKIQPSESNCTYTDNTTVGTATCTFKYAEGIEVSIDFTIAECPHWDADSDGICDNCISFEEPELVSGYYQIENVGNLMWFANQVNEGQTTINGKLTEDIDLTGVEWTPIGWKKQENDTTVYVYAGTFDGNGHVISGLNGDKLDVQNTHGFIRTLDDGGVVKNLTFTGANVFNHEGSGAISAVIVYTNNGLVEKCVVRDSAIHHGAYDALGVVVGLNGGTIRNCASIANTMTRHYGGADNKAVCGFVWSNSGTIEKCFNYDCTYDRGSVNYAFTGTNSGTLRNCYYYEPSETLSDVCSEDSIVSGNVDNFGSGEIAYLLNGSTSEGTLVWGQNLKTDAEDVIYDAYPVFKNDTNTVYYGYANCKNTEKTYANTELSKDIPEHSWKYELDETNTNKMTFSCATDGCTKGGTVTITATTGATYNGSSHTATVTVESEGGEELIETPEITYTPLTQGVVLVDGKPVNAGTYKASVNLGGATAYLVFEIAKATPDIGTVSADPMENTLDVNAVVLSRADKTIAGSLSLKEGTMLRYGENEYTYVFKSRDANYCDIEGTISITITDTIAPTATYQVGTNGFKAFMNAITFGSFFKDTQIVEIRYTDDKTDENGNITVKGSGVRTKQYCIVNMPLSEPEMEYVSWIDYTEPFSLNGTDTFYVYTKVEDEAGNKVILNSDGIVIYEESVITTESADYTYKSNKDIIFEMESKGNTFVTLKDSEGNEVDAENYIVTDNSEIKFKAAYLDTLTVAEQPYTYKIYMNPQGVETSEVELCYEITIHVLAKELTVTGATASGRIYEKGNTSVVITEVALLGVVNADAVSVDVTDLTGTLPSANADDYTEVTLPELELTGNDKDNYVLKQPSGAVPASVKISPQDTGTAVSVKKKYLYLKENADTIDLFSLLPKDCGIIVSCDTPSISGNVTYKVVPSVEEGKLAYTVAQGLEEAIGNKGTITINVQTQNYVKVPITISVEVVDQISVNPQTDVMLKDNSQKLTYGQKLSTLELVEVVFKGTDGEVVSGTLQWKNGDSIPTVDTKKATWEFTPSASYNGKYAVAQGELNIEVLQAMPVVDTIPTVNALTYHPSTTLADVTLSGGTVNGMDGILTGSWVWKDETILPKTGNNTYVAVFTPIDTINYTAKEVNITVSVAMATPYIKTAPTAAAITYGMSLKDATLNGGAVQYSVGDTTTVAGTWSWKEETTKPTAADGGETLYDVVFTPNDADNYNKVETKITLTVNKSESTPNMPENTMSALYGQKIVGAVELPEDWVWSETDSAKELTIGEAVEATAIYNGADKGNYVTESVTISITCQECDHEESEIFYTGDGEKAPTCTEAGIGHTECIKCKKPMQTNVSVESTGHTWDAGVVTKEATATEKGEKTYTCSVCKTTKTEEIPALGAPEVGVEITSEDGSATYKVTEAGENGNAVTYEAPADKEANTVVVPATVTINNITYNVTAISDTAFAGNKKLTSVTIGNNVTSFRAKTFKGCSNLKTVVIGNGVTSIPANAFKNFKKLTTVKMGSGVKTIGKNAYYGCKKLKTVSIGKNVVTIGTSAFEGCKALKTITVGKCVTKIGSRAFYGCSKVKTLTIKSSKLTTRKLGSKAFTKTPKSMTVKVPKKKFKAYKSMLIKRGVNKKARFKKS